jgi:hypothetical protein
MNSILLTILLFPSFTFLPNGDIYGTSTIKGTDIQVPFSQITINEEPRIQKFHLEYEGEVLQWFICEGGIMEDLKDLSICLTK